MEDMEFDAVDFNGDIEPEQVETVPEVDYSTGAEFEDGSSFSGEEMEFWNDIVGQAQEMVNNGEDQNYVEDLLQNCFRDYIEKRDLQEFIDNEKKHGFSKDDISDKAWQMYEDNLGKKTIKQCIEATDPFVEGLFDGVKPKSTRANKRHSDPFMSGFMDL